MILLVEDNDDVRELATELLTIKGYRVRSVARASDALALLAADSMFSLLLTDIVMPGMDGWELADKAKAMKPDLKVIYMTGYQRVARPPNASVHGPILKKPWRPGAFYDEIERALR